MAGFTNRGKYLIMGWAFRAVSVPANLYVALCTSATAPTPDINTLSELTQIATGNGYSSGGYTLTPGATDFDTYTEDDSGDLAKVLIKDVVWTASGGPIPASGSGARYAVLTDYHATVGSRQVIAYFDLTSDRTVSDTQTFTLTDLNLTAAES